VQRSETSSGGGACPFYSALDFGFEVSGERIKDNGEDSYLFAFTPENGVVGVFDGCGGSGSRRYESYRGKTGAYMGSRAVAGAARDWFLDGASRLTASELKERINAYLGLCMRHGGGGSGLKGSLVKDFPTTLAMIAATAAGKQIAASCLWAGDSRCYLLDEDGLRQLTEDDLRIKDPMENLRSDGALLNTVSASENFEIHRRALRPEKPCLLFAATDGCFGYFSTPMEFEHLLLDSLSRASCVSEWEMRIAAALDRVAGDDYTMSGMALGFGSFEKLKNSLERRRVELYTRYIRKLNGLSREEKTALWREYREHYMAV